MDIRAQITHLQSQGLSNNQIVQYLQQQGYKPEEISFGMQAAKGVAANQQPAQGATTMQPPQNPMAFQPQSVQAPPPMGGMPPPAGMPSGPGGELDADEIEELIEAVIEEKWNELRKNIDKFVSWKERIDIRIEQLATKQQDLEAQFERVHNAVIGKIGDYDKNIKEVGAQLQSMEKLFGDVLPRFTENVNSLNRVANRLDTSTKEQHSPSRRLP